MANQIAPRVRDLILKHPSLLFTSIMSDRASFMQKTMDLCEKPEDILMDAYQAIQNLLLHLESEDCLTTKDGVEKLFKIYQHIPLRSLTDVELLYDMNFSMHPVQSSTAVYRTGGTRGFTVIQTLGVEDELPPLIYRIENGAFWSIRLGSDEIYSSPAAASAPIDGSKPSTWGEFITTIREEFTFENILKSYT